MSPESFFPVPESMGFGGHKFTSVVVQRSIVTVASGEIVMSEVAGCAVSPSTLRRPIGDVTAERTQRRDADHALAKSPADPPELTVVECDGRRIRMREPSHGPGVHMSEKGWCETKVACLQPSEEDPMCRSASVRRGVQQHTL